MATVIDCGHVHATIVDDSWMSPIRRALSIKHPSYDRIIDNDYRRGIHKYTHEDGRPKWDGIIRFLDKNGKFLTGLTHYVLENASKGGGAKIEEGQVSWPEYREIEPVVPDLSPYSLRPYQKRAFYAALLHHRGILHLATNAGKTLLAIALAKAMNAPTLFVVHRRGLLNQTYRKFLGTMPIEENIGRIGDDYWEPRFVTIATIQTLVSRFIKSGRGFATTPEMREFFNNVELLFFDECHRTGLGQAVKTIGAHCPAPYRFGLSGTPLYKDNLDNMTLIGVTGPVLEVVSNEELIKRGYSARPVIFMLEVSSASAMPKKKRYDSVYATGIVNNAARNKLVTDIALRSAQLGLPTVILVKQIEHGRVLDSSLRAHGAHSVFLSGETSSARRENSIRQFGNNINIIVASVIFEEGLDIPQMRTLILAGGGKSERAVLQSVGRVLRRSTTNESGEEAYIFDFIDGDHEYLMEHSSQRFSFYRKEGFRVISELPKKFKD